MVDSPIEGREHDSRARVKSAFDDAPIRALFVEDDNDFREALADHLSGLGFAIQGFADGTALLHALDTAIDADVIILDWKLPKTSGIDLLAELRRRSINLPVVFLTGNTATSHERLALELGASDFIDKARGVEVLVRRLRLVVKLAKPAADPQPDNRIDCGRLVLKPDISRAYWNEADVGLSVGEFKVVHLLGSNLGRYVTYRAIYDQLHYEGFIAGSGDHGYWSTVRTTIKRIRNKFHECDPTFAEIENYTRVGYCWRNPSAPAAAPNERN